MDVDLERVNSYPLVTKIDRDGDLVLYASSIPLLRERFGDDSIYALLSHSPIDWEAILKRISSHPQEVYPPFLNDVLAVEAVPSNVVQAVIHARQDSLVDWPTRNRGEHHPLELACDLGASYDVLRTILEEYVAIGAHQWAWDHCGFWYQPLDVKEVFLQVLPLDLSTMEDECVLDLCSRLLNRWSRQQEDFWDILNLVLLKVTKGVTRVQNLTEGQRYYPLHSFLRLMWKASMCENYHSSMKFTNIYIERRKSNILVLEIIKARDPAQFRTRDDQGYLPIHIAAKLAFHVGEEEQDGEQENDSTTIDSEWNEWVRQEYSTFVKYSSAIVRFLLDEYPESARVLDDQWRLPLHIALEHGSPCWNLLEQAEGRAVTTRCPETRMYPFQIAAAAARRDDMPSQMSEAIATNAVYTLLRKAPHLLESGRCSADPCLNSQEFLDVQLNKLEAEQLDVRHKREWAEMEERHKRETAEMKEEQKREMVEMTMRGATLKRRLDEVHGTS